MKRAIFIMLSFLAIENSFAATVDNCSKVAAKDIISTPHVCRHGNDISAAYYLDVGTSDNKDITYVQGLVDRNHGNVLVEVCCTYGFPKKVK